MIFILLNCLSLFEHTKQTLHDPIIASVSPTFTMSLSWVICTLFFFHMKVLHQLSNSFGCALLSSVILAFYFPTITMLSELIFQLKAIYPSWFIIYVGFGGHHCNRRELLPRLLEKIFFWFSLICYAFLLPIIIKRVFRKEIWLIRHVR